MLVKDLIKELEKLPQDASIGMCFYDGGCGMFTFGDTKTVQPYKEIVENNSDNVISKCDYYIN